MTDKLQDKGRISALLPIAVFLVIFLAIILGVAFLYSLIEYLIRKAKSKKDGCRERNFTYKQYA